MVRDLGMNNANLFAKQAVAQGIFPGPRLLRLRRGDHPDRRPHLLGAAARPSGADEMRRAVREQVKGGADLIKIMACHDTLEFTDAELEAVIDETHRNGLADHRPRDLRRLHQARAPSSASTASSMAAR